MSTDSINVRVRLNQVLGSKGTSTGTSAIPTGMALSYTDNLVTVTAGSVAKDGFEFILKTDMTKDANLRFEAGNNKGGVLVDNGNDILNVFIISNGVVSDIAFSTEDKPTLPDSYSLYNKIGYISREAGVISFVWPDADLNTYWINNEFNKALDLKATKESLAATDLKVTNNTTDITGIKSDIVDINKDIEGINTALEGKQDKGDYALKTEVDQVKDDLATVTNTVDSQGTSLNELTTTVTGIQNTKADKSVVEASLEDKQDKIADLETIRSGAAKGATALQSYTETDPTVPAHVKAITTANISSWNAKQPAGDYATKTEVEAKQDKLTAGTNITIDGNVISATGGSSTPDNMVTTDTEQTITGNKHFAGGIDLPVNKALTVANGSTIVKYDGSKILLGSSSDPVTIQTYESLKINKSGVVLENIDSGNIGGYAITSDSAQTITGKKTFTEGLAIDAGTSKTALTVDSWPIISNLGNSAFAIGSENAVLRLDASSLLHKDANSNISNVVVSEEIVKIKKLTQSAYDALETKDENTLYYIVG